ncbi:MAG: PAS domain-containing sensor histidine kinase, partial [Halalkalicoccus sp.]|nr:PAS domain-containing sensor histidine kinase [Halalkalicoccus sp.]
MGFQQDITAHKQRKRDLEWMNALFSTLFDIFPQGVLVEDESRNVLAINQQMFELLEMPESPEEVISADCELMAAEISELFTNPEQFVERINEVVARQKPIDEEETALADGRTVERSYRPIKLSDGRGHLWVYRDITERKKHERQLKEFTNIISHDLRNPLNMAQGYLTLVREDCESKHLETIEHAHERIERLIQDLLTLAWEDEGAIDRERVDIDSVVTSCWETVETADATLTTDVDHAVQANKNRLKQLFENLIRNAVEHGGEDVAVTIGELDNGFYLEDNGPGIPENYREKVFEAGYSTNSEGTGFGLNIV